MNNRPSELNSSEALRQCGGLNSSIRSYVRNLDATRSRISALQLAPSCDRRNCQMSWPDSAKQDVAKCVGYHLGTSERIYHDRNT